MPAQQIVQINSQSSPLDINGLVSYGNSPAVPPLINTEIVKKSFPAMINYLLPKGDASLFALTAKMKEETALQIEHGFYSKIMVWPNFTLSAAIGSAGTTSFPVIDASMCIPNGLYMYIGVGSASGISGISAANQSTNMQTEIVMVTSASGSNPITVTRGVGSTAAAASYVQYGTFVHIGNAFPDASQRPNSFLTQEIRVINYTQIFRNAWAISGTVASIQNLLGDTNIAKSKRECAQYHAMDMEKTFIFGQRSANTNSNAQSFRTMHGILGQVNDGQAASLFLPGATSAANLTTAASKVSGTNTPGVLSIDDLETWVNATLNMSYDPMSGMERVMFVGASAHIAINKLARLNTTYYIERGTTEWGLRFDRIKLTRGDFIIIEHPLFNTNYVWSGLAVIVDLPSLSLAYMTNRKTKAEEYNQSGLAVDNAVDAIGGSLLTELTILCKNPSGCGVMTNIRQAVDAAGTGVH